MQQNQNEGKLAKVSIQAHKTDDYKKKATISGAINNGLFTALLNPESYAESYEVVSNQNAALGDTGSDNKFISMKSSNLNLKFLFDGTGVVQENSGNKLINTFKRNKPTKLTVKEQIDDFKKVVFDYEGEIHQPHYLTITWGELIFRGKLKSLNINYTLFTTNGEPLRAIVDTVFEDFRSKELREKLAGKSSPDLTHRRLVKAGDTLPLLTEEIYGDAKYYLEVARINKLTNFRHLEPGNELVFPPIEKTSN